MKKPWELPTIEFSVNSPIGNVSVGRSARARSFDDSAREISTGGIQSSLKISESLRPASKSLYATNQVPQNFYDEKYTVIEKFKSAASIFRSKLMGFGLGNLNIEAIFTQPSHPLRYLCLVIVIIYFFMISIFYIHLHTKDLLTS